MPALAVLIPPDLHSEWLAALTGSLREGAPMGVNPSSLAVAGAIARALPLPSSSAPAVTLGVYLVYCGLILWASIGALLRAKSRIEQAVLIVLLWLLIAPRVMIYSYTMAIVPALYVIEARIRSRAVQWVAVTVIVAEGAIRLLPGRPPAWLAPAPLLLLLGVWLIWLRQRPESDAAAL